MSASFYDVVVLGADLGPLTCAALLAKRGFRVLVLGQDEPSPTYTAGGFVLPRRPFRYVLGQSPVSRRVFPELGLAQSLRRISRPSSPSFQVALFGHRFDVSNDPGALAREMEREFPEVRRPIDDFHKQVEGLAHDLDTLLSRDMVLPPETFFERQHFLRASRAAPLARSQREDDVLAELPDHHPFRIASQLPARFESDIDPDHITPLCLLRLYGNCSRGALSLEGGFAALRDLLIQKIRVHSGQVRLDERASEIQVQRNQVTGVRCSGSDDEITCNFAVVGTDVSAALRLLPERTVFEALFERIGEPLLRQYRYTLNVVMRSEGVPPGLGELLYLVRKRGESPLGSALRVETRELAESHALLCVEALLPSRRVEDEEGFMHTIRADVLRGLRELVPFLDDHLVLVDSPHDGLPPQGEGATLDAGTLARRGPATMPAVHSYPVLSTLGLCGLPVRTPVKRLLFCNGQVMPGLGSEGKLLAACSVARVVTWSDRRKAWMRRGLWTKVEM